MYDLIRDSPFGQIVRIVTNNHYLQYAEEKDGFQHPYFVQKENEAEVPGPDASVNSQSLDSTEETDLEENGYAEDPIERLATLQSLHEQEKPENKPIKATTTSDGSILVSWYTTSMAHQNVDS